MKREDWPPVCAHCGLKLKEREPVHVAKCGDIIHYFHTHRPCFEQWYEERDGETDKTACRGID